MTNGIFDLPLGEIVRLLALDVVPVAILHPATGPFFWAVLVLVAFQYARVGHMERALYGTELAPTWQRVLAAVVYGIAGGFLGGLVMVILGVTLESRDVTYLWPVALLLSLIQPRFLCFAYATGVLALTTLLFGWPGVHIPGLVALVGVLHLAEALLVYLDGATEATPVVARNGRGEVVGGYLLQRFWPVPAAVLVMLALPAVPEGGVEMPGWWPLIHPAHPERLLQPQWVPTVFPLVAGLGYSDVALTARPAVRARRTALALLVYSVVLIALAWGSQRAPALLWVAALASPLLHEAMILWGLRHERWGKPAFRSGERGLPVLAVLPRSQAERLGLAAGDRILAVNGRPVARPADLREAAGPYGFYLRLEVERDDRRLELETNRFRPDEPLGVVLAPDEQAAPQVDLGRRSEGPLGSVARRVAPFLLSIGKRLFGMIR
ncbi:MAG TPA: PDZ domain-containing protein [Thermaerobacter sp.]